VFPEYGDPVTLSFHEVPLSGTVLIPLKQTAKKKAWACVMLTLFVKISAHFFAKNRST